MNIIYFSIIYILNFSVTFHSFAVERSWALFVTFIPDYVLGDSVVENPPANARDSRDTGSERSPGGGNGNPLQYSCLEISMDRAAQRASVHGVTKIWTQLSDWTHGIHVIIYFLIFWLCHAIFKILVPWPATEPGPWQWKPGILTSRPSGNSVITLFFNAL